MCRSPDGSPSFSLTELAYLRAGALGADEEEELRSRIEQNPRIAQEMLAQLDAIDDRFPDPPNIEAPLEVPPRVAARWELAIAQEAAERAARSDEVALGEEGGGDAPQRPDRS